MFFRFRDKQWKAWNIYFCLSLSVIFYLMTTAAFAGGWIYVSKTHNPKADKWSSYKSPHGGYTSATNKCRVCHAMHKANRDSYRLLADNSRLTACDRCHDPVTGLSGKKPYRLISKFMESRGKRNYNGPNSGKNPEKPRIIHGKKVIVRAHDTNAAAYPKPITPVEDAKGEHTPGAKLIPDSNIATPSRMADGLNCLTCHHEHFTASETIKGVPRWKDKENFGLRKDPAQNGGDADDGLISVQPYSQNAKPINGASANPSVDEIKSAFCADCHNESPNWDRGGNERPNKTSHAIGNVDGKVDAYGKTVEVAKNLTKSCMSCHSATTETNDAGEDLGPSSFPHQSKGHKLLNDSYTDLSPIAGFDYTGDPYRTIPNLDGGLCRNGNCHSNVGKDSIPGLIIGY